VSAPEVYVKEDRPGEFVAWERHPVPGGVDMPLVCRPSKESALKAAREHLRSRGGSVFKAERSVVGA
jgi:hypothetical protein